MIETKPAFAASCTNFLSRSAFGVTNVDLGMSVIGYDPYLSEDAAKSLNSNVKVTTDLNEIFKNSDYITVHVPLTDTGVDAPR